MVSEGQAGQSGQQDTQKAGGSPTTTKPEPRNQTERTAKKQGHQTTVSPNRHDSYLPPDTRQRDAKEVYKTALPTPKPPEARSVPLTQASAPIVQPPTHKIECHCPVIVTVIVATLAFYVIAGWLGRRWIARERSRKKLAVVALFALVALPLSYGITQWPFYLAAELSVVVLGLTAGWCWIDYDRRKINGPHLNPSDDLDQLGYFNSKVAMRSAELFNITVMDIPVEKGEQPQRDIAHLLVQRYWGIALKITKCVATPNNVTVYFSQPADEAGTPVTENYKLEKEVEKEKEHAKDATGDLRSGESQNTGEKADGKKEYEPVKVTSAVFGPIRRSVVLNVESTLAVGTQLRITVDNLIFRVTVDNKVKAVELLPPNNSQSFKVTSKPSPDEEQSLKRVLQPSYAIGMGIITDDQYNTVKNEYFAQSELSLGLIVPLILIVLGLALIPQIGLGPTGSGGELNLHSMAWFFICASLAPISMGLFVVGAERFHKFRMEVKLLIMGNWQKQKDAAKKQDKKDQGKKDQTSSNLQDALVDAIKNARVPELKVNLDAKGPAASS
jgi:hypothetical protein